MRATVLVSDNLVIVDGRPLPIDCSAIDPNVRVMHWWDTHGEVEFHNEPGVEFKRNGKLDSLTEFRDAIEAWQTLAQRIDSGPQTRAVGGPPSLSEMPAQEIARVFQKIDGDAVLKAMPQHEAVQLLRKIELDPELKGEPIAEAVRLLGKIEGEPKLKARYPGPALRELKEIEADPELKNKPIRDAVDARKDKEEKALTKFKHIGASEEDSASKFMHTSAPDEKDLPKPRQGVVVHAANEPPLPPIPPKQPKPPKP